MHFDKVIKNGRLVTGERIFSGDIGIADGKIAVIEDNLPAEDTKIIDAKGLLVLPGIIDVHVHLQLPFCGTVSVDDFFTGTRAAACGGVTTVIDFAIQNKSGTLYEAVENRRSEADGKVCVDYSLHAVPTDWRDDIRHEMKEIVDYGISTFKMFMVYRSEGLISEDDALFEALEESAKLGVMIGVHAESVTILEFLTDRYHTDEMMRKYGAYCHALSRPWYVEAEAVSRAINWAEATGGNLYIVHMSDGRSAEILNSAKDRQVNVFAETCPHYLLLDDEFFKLKDGHLYGTCPQLKKPEDQRRLWQALAGGELSVISTDTCTFNTEQKAMWNGDFTKIPFGMPGVETLLPLIYLHGVEAGKISLQRMVQLLSTNPAKLMGMYPQKGSLMLGSDADITIIDPESRTTLSYKNLQTNSDWSPYEGFEAMGMPVYTLLRGEIIAENGEFKGKAGSGSFIKRSAPDFNI